MRKDFEMYYASIHPEDKSTLLRNGNYSGWFKQMQWQIWQQIAKSMKV